LPFPVPLFLICTLVVPLLAFGQTDLEFYPAFAPVEIQRNEGIAFPFRASMP
jgi:hypothetical protein